MTELLNSYRRSGFTHLIKSGLRESTSKVGEFYAKRTQTFDGINVLEEDWDNLVILDACRYDLFKQVNDISGDLQKRQSQASMTAEFLNRNFAGKEILDTVYVSGNPHLANLSNKYTFYKLIGVWGDNEQVGESVIHPKTVTESAIEAFHSCPYKRIIVHFMQPHLPFYIKDGNIIPPGSPYRDYDAARKGEVSPACMRDIYCENLSFVLDYVKKLISKLQGKTVITSDHGELLGESVRLDHKIFNPTHSLARILSEDPYLYGHPRWLRHPALIEIPWLEIDSESRRNIVAGDGKKEDEYSEREINEHLKALGYKNVKESKV